MPRRPPPLLDELIEEILLRLPPANPTSLVSAALVCKRWRRLVSDAGFHRRFRERHRTPPILGFIWDLKEGDIDGVDVTRFVPAQSSCLRHVDLRGARPCDARHGRVLLHATDHGDDMRLVVWDPITVNKHLELPCPAELPGVESWTAAVLCSGAACDHLDCRGGPFFVVLVVTGRKNLLTLFYSSESGAWSQPAFAPHRLRGAQVTWDTSALAGDGLYFLTYKNSGILKFDLGTRRLVDFIEPPPPLLKKQIAGDEIMVTEDGRLGYVRVAVYKVSLWSWRREINEGSGWELTRVVELDKQPFGSVVNDSSEEPYLVGTAEGVGMFFMKMGDTLFAHDLKDGKTTKVCEGFDMWSVLIPYMNFYTPVLLGAPSPDDEPREGASRP